jgi:Fe-S cluster assembly protein SufD
MSTTEMIRESRMNSFTASLTASAIAVSEELRMQAEKTLNSLDFPTTRNEAWKYTRLNRISKLELSTGHAGTLHLDSNFLISQEAYTLVFENGHFIAELSSKDLSAAVSITELKNADEKTLQLIGSQVITEGEVFTSLNTAYMSNGLVIRIKANASLEKPIQLIHVLSGRQQMAAYRVFVVAEKFSKASLLTGFFSANAQNSLFNGVTEILVEEGAHLTIDKLQLESEGNYHIGTEQVRQEKDSSFTINTITLDGTLVRNNLNIAVDGLNCTTNLNGAYLLRNDQHVDNHTMVDHRKPHCNSNEQYKGVIDGTATAVFNGKVFVRNDAQKINAFQSNGNVLLSDSATINSKPELEIYADDVKCSHGSTTGQLDETAIFYLRARGISEKSARNLLVSAFIDDVLSKISSEDMLSKVQTILRERYGWEL